MANSEPYDKNKLPASHKKHSFGTKLKVTNMENSKSNPHIINLVTDPQEREPYNQIYYHSWTFAHFSWILGEFHKSVEREPLIPAGAPLDYVPKSGGKTAKQRQ